MTPRTTTVQQMHR